MWPDRLVPVQLAATDPRLGYGSSSESGQDEGRTGTAHAGRIADHTEDLLEVGGVGGPDPQQAVRLAGDGVGLDDLRDGSDHVPHSVRRYAALAIELDEGFDAPAQDGRLQLGGEAPNRSISDQPVDPAFGGGGGQSDLLAKGGEAGAPVVQQQRKNLVIHIVKTQTYDLTSADKSILLAKSRFSLET